MTTEPLAGEAEALKRVRGLADHLALDPHDMITFAGAAKMIREAVGPEPPEPQPGAQRYGWDTLTVADIAAGARVRAEPVELRSALTGHRLAGPHGGRPKQTRALPPWCWPLEIAARWRARAEGRYG